jgi:hypothetical protein
MIKFLAPAFIIALATVGACKTVDSRHADNSGNSEYPSVEGTTWIVSVKWDTDPDTALFRPRFDTGGSGVQVDSAGKPTKLTFNWEQDKQSVSWTYPSKVHFTGTISPGGDTMSGTGVYQKKSSEWRALKK